MWQPNQSKAVSGRLGSMFSELAPGEDTYVALTDNAEDLASEIRQLNQVATAAHYEIARRLDHARATLFPDSASDWEVWVDTSCGLKRSTAYRYLQAYRELDPEVLQALGTAAPELLPAKRKLDDADFGAFVQQVLDQKLSVRAIRAAIAGLDDEVLTSRHSNPIKMYENLPDLSNLLGKNRLVYDFKGVPALGTNLALQRKLEADVQKTIAKFLKAHASELGLEDRV